MLPDAANKISNTPWHQCPSSLCLGQGTAITTQASEPVHVASRETEVKSTTGTKPLHVSFCFRMTYMEPGPFCNLYSSIHRIQRILETQGIGTILSIELCLVTRWTVFIWAGREAKSLSLPSPSPSFATSCPVHSWLYTHASPLLSLLPVWPHVPRLKHQAPDHKTLLFFQNSLTLSPKNETSLRGNRPEQLAWEKSHHNLRSVTAQIYCPQWLILHEFEFMFLTSRNLNFTEGVS